MGQATITVESVHPTWFSIGAGGKFWGVSKEDKPKFQVGHTYTVNYTEKAGTGKHAGKMFTNITAIVSNGQAHPEPTPRARSNPADSEQIFCTALIKEFIHAGQIQCTTTDVVTAVNTLRDAYRQTFGRA